METERLRAVLTGRYGLVGPEVSEPRDAPGSRGWTVLVEANQPGADALAYEAWWYAAGDPAGARLGAAVEAADVAGRSGVVTGAAVAAVGGDRVLLVDDGSLVLRPAAAGRPLTDAPDDQALLGATLARVHAATLGHGDHLGRARPGLEHLSGLALGVGHGDPAPGRFRLAADGSVALLGWEQAYAGPLLHDLAAAVVHLAGPDPAGPDLAGPDLADPDLGGRLLAAYASAAGPATADLPHLPEALDLLTSGSPVSPSRR